MKVLFVCPFVPWPLENGGKIRTYNLIKEASANAEIHLRVIREPVDVPDAEQALSPWCASLAFFELSKSGPLARWTRPKIERWFNSSTLLSTVRQEIQRGEFHLVHLDELLLARILPPGCSVPVVQHHHKLDTVLYDSLWAHRGPQRHFDLWKLHRLEAESARRYRHHLTCSREDAEILQRRHGALDCEFVPNGFDPEHFLSSEDAPERQPEHLLFLGSMDYGPNVEAVSRFVKEILPRVRQRHPEAVLEVVGANPTPEIRALASEHVLIAGKVPDVRPYLERAGLLVVPLRIGGGTRLKIVEALALGTPVVSTAVGAEGLGLDDGVHLRKVAGDGSFAAAISHLIEHPAEAAALAEEGKKRVHERFRWAALAEELVDYWERVSFSGSSSPSR